MANLVRAISENGGVIVAVINSTEIVREIERMHKPSAVVSAALGRTVTGASLMGIMLKSGDDTVTLKFKGDGPIGGVIAIADGYGNVKGYAENNIVEIPPRADGKLDVGGAIGHNGYMYVIKDLGLKEPYVGQIPLVSGEIAEDITNYYGVSEQVPTVCALGVLVDTDLSIISAGGFILQLMPGATDEEITQLEKNIGSLKSVTQMLSEGMDIHDIANLVLEGFNPNVLDEQDVKYYCDCNEEKVEKMMCCISKEELLSLQEEEDELEVCCHYCDKKYYFKASELLKKKFRIL